MKKLFREIKRIVSQFFETEYWYRKYVPTYWYDEDTGKFEKTKKPYIGYNPLIETWDGEGSIINIMIRKIEHMVVSLKKYGNEKECYLNSYSFFDADSTDSDREWALQECFKKIKNKEDSCFSKMNDDYHTVWLINEDVSENVSASGLRHFYFRTKDFNKFDLYHYDDKEIPSDNKLMELTFDDGVYMSKPARNFVHEAEPLFHLRNASWQEICNFVQKTYDKNLENCLIMNAQTFDIAPADFKNLSPYIRTQIRGNRQKIIHLLELRRKLKNYLKIDEYNDKYAAFKWPEYENASDDERTKLYEKSTELYYNDRKTLMREIADLIAEKGNTWWD